MSILDSLTFNRVLTTPANAQPDQASPIRRAILAGLLDAGVSSLPVASLWVRSRPSEPLQVLIAGVTNSADSASPDSRQLLFPLGASGFSVPCEEISHLTRSFPSWIACTGTYEPLLDSDLERQQRPDERWSSSPFDDLVGYMADEAFAWFTLCTPVSDIDLQSHLDQLHSKLYRRHQIGDLLEADALELERERALFRELSRAGSGGVWDVSIAIGTLEKNGLLRAASMLCTAAEKSMIGYKVRPIRTGDIAASVDEAIGPGVGSGEPSLCHSFRATIELVSTLVRPPETELPGIRVVAPPSFDTTLEPPDDEGGAPVEVGAVLDRFVRPSEPFNISRGTLNMHTFVCGATGSGKSQTVRALLEALTRNSDAVPWLVIEPVKAEYRGMAGRLEGAASVLTIRPGDPSAIPGSLNPLEPASLEPGNPDWTYPLQSHADLVRALFLAAFQAEEPFPQVLSRALTECYERAAWDLVTGEPLLCWTHSDGKPSASDASGTTFPRYPTLRELQRVAFEVVGEIGYDEDIKKRVRGFVDVRIGSLRLGTPGRFFEGGHPLDFAALLRRNVVFEIEGVTNDQDRAFVMGAVLIRLYEQLWLQELEARGRRKESKRLAVEAETSPIRHLTVIEEAHRLLRNVVEGSPASHALELFASLLAEVRAYGEGLVIVEQIPNKIIPDAIKNTSLKIMHRLPAADDRAVVGATMNLSDEQSEYVVTLERGTAVVFADRMDHPVLVRMPAGGKGRENDKDVEVVPPVRAHRSRACGTECTTGLPCNLAQIRHSELFLRKHPELTLWIEISCAAHVQGMGALRFAESRRLEELHTSDKRMLGCAIAHAAEQALATRYELLKDYVDPEAFGQHLAAAANHAIFPDVSHDVCATDGGRWRAGRSRFTDIERRLEVLLTKDLAADDELMRQAQLRGIELPGADVARQLAYLRSFPWKRCSDEEQLRLRVGSDLPPLFQTAAAQLAGPGDKREQVVDACKLLAWRSPKSQAAMMALLFPTEQQATKRESRDDGG